MINQRIKFNTKKGEESFRGTKTNNLELGKMVRDFTQVGSQPKSEVKRRILEFATKREKALIRELVREIEKVETTTEAGTFKDGHDTLKAQILYYLKNYD